MISINDLTFQIGSRALYDEANWHIKPGDRVGLIGANGTGKSTLLKIIVGEYAPSSGSISMAKDLKIGYLNQDLLSYESHHTILHVAMEAFERQNKLHDEIEELLRKIETDYSEEALYKLSDKQQEFEALDGYNIESKKITVTLYLPKVACNAAKKTPEDLAETILIFTLMPNSQ